MSKNKELQVETRPEPDRKRAELLETVMARELKSLYFPNLGTDARFDEALFQVHFATIAHRHGIWWRHHDRNQYNLFYGLVKSRLEEAVRRLKRNEEKRRSTIVQRPLQPATTAPQRAGQLWLPGLDPKVAEARKRLAMLRDEMANRPSLC